MNEKQSYIVIGLHDPKRAAVKTKKVGKCLLCGGPVYMAGMAVNGELEIAELDKLKDKRLLGFPCVLDIVTAFKSLLETSPEERQEVIDRLIENENNNKN